VENTIYTSKPELKVSCAACNLSKLCVTNGLNHDELVDFEKIVSLSSRFEKDQALYRSGDSLKGIYAVRSGSFKGMVSDVDGNLHITGFYTPGDIIGFDGLGDQRYQCDIVAMDESRVCEMPIDRLDHLCEEFPALQYEMRSIGSRNQNSLQHLLMLVGKRPVEERLAVFLLNYVEKYRGRGLACDQIHLPMSRHEIANYLAMASETLSRQFKRFKKDGWIKMNNKYCTILNEAALKELAHYCGAGDGERLKAG
jgi:CRP/FNR family transcriptional regulator, anaerobic regulatory protein